jgi:hypothetical protein
VSDENDISKIREEETGRGRRPRHSEEKNKAGRLRSLVINAIRRGNRGLFQQILIDDLGEKPGSPEYEDSMKKFDDYQREEH